LAFNLVPLFIGGFVMPEGGNYKEATFEGIGNGDLIKRCNHELNKLFKNIMDPNTEAKAKRTLNVTLTMVPNKSREGVKLTYGVNPKPAPMEAEETQIYLSLKAGGEVAASEVFAKQTSLEFSQTEIKVND
jgi:hypothetical protein